MKKILGLCTLSALLILPANASADMLLKSEKISGGNAIERTYLNTTTGEEVTATLKVPDELSDKVSASGGALLDFQKELAAYYSTDKNKYGYNLNLLYNKENPINQDPTKLDASYEATFNNHLAQMEEYARIKSSTILEDEKFKAEQEAKVKEEKAKKEAEEKARLEEEKKNQTVVISDGTIKHTVLSNETLTMIAKKYNITVSELQKLNNVYSSKELKAGQQLIVSVKETLPNDSEKVAVSEPEKEDNSVKEKEEKSFNELAKEESEVLEDLNKESEEDETIKFKESKTEKEEPKKGIDIKGMLILIGILGVAGGLTAGLYYWKRKWFNK